MSQFKRHGKRALVGIGGGVVLVAGVIMIPYPGPGWLVVFAGLALLATEFEFAANVLEYARKRYDQWVDWLGRQHWIIRLCVLSATGIVVLVTLWLVNAFGLIAAFFNLPVEWLTSPFFT